MRAVIQKRGNVLALRLPKAMAEELKVREGDAMELKIRGDLLELKPARRRYRIAEFVSKVNARNLHSETGWGGPVGKEV